MKTDFSLMPATRCQWAHVGWAVVTVGLATLIRFPLQPLLGNASPFLFYLPVVVAIAVFFGLKAGLLATAASVLPANYFWMPPERTFGINLVESFQILGFSFAGCCVSWLSEAFHRQKRLKDFLSATLASAAEAIVSTDCRGRIIYLNAMAEILSELRREDAVGAAIGGAFFFLSEKNGLPINAAFQAALSMDEIEKLPHKLVIVSKSGRQHFVEQKTSRVFDARGQKLGAVILFHHLHTEIARTKGVFTGR